MLQSLSEIDKYQPAIAEEDIADFVRQFELCDVCKKPENPNLKCLQCNWFICESCVPCHSKLKPTHTTELIINPNRDSKPSIKATLSNEYPEHEITLFCIMCLKTLCSKGESCRKHGQCHNQCSSTWSDRDVQEMYECRFFLQPLMGSTNALNIYKRCKPMRIVSIDQISHAAHEWLTKVLDGVKECVDVLLEYKAMLCETTNKNMLDAPLRYAPFPLEEVDYVLGIGRELHEQADNLCRMKTDINTAIYLLKNESKYQLLFQLSRKFMSHTQIVNTTRETAQEHYCEITQVQKCIKHVSKCSLQEVGYIHQGAILTERLFPKQINDCRTSVTHLMVPENIARERSIFTAILVPVNSNQPLQIPLHGSLLGKDLEVAYNATYKLLTYSYEQKAEKASAHIPNIDILYSNYSPQKTEDIMKSPSVSNQIKIASTFRESYYDCVCNLYELSSRRGKQMYFTIGVSECMLLTKFVNIIIQPVKFSMEQCNVIAITGNRGEDSGLETLFVCFNKSNKPVYGKCISANIVNLHTTYNGMGDSCTYNLAILTNKKGIFSLMRYKSCSLSVNNVYSTYYNSKYHTTITETYVPNDFLKSVEHVKQELIFCHKTIHHTEKTESNVPVKYLKLDLLCGFENALYFVRHDFPNTLSVGKLTFTLKGVKLENLCQIKENDIDIPISNLKPMTMTKTVKGEIITICSVTNDNSKFVLIRTDETDTSPIEFLDISYPPMTDIAETWVDDLEMSPQGDIVYVLKGKDGKSHSVLTKYLIE